MGGEKGAFRQQAPILTLTLNPALDMATEVPAMRPDEKLRCSEPQLDPGGGGLNVSRAVHLLGGAMDTSTQRVLAKMRVLAQSAYPYCVVTPTY